MKRTVPALIFLSLLLALPVALLSSDRVARYALSMVADRAGIELVMGDGDFWSGLNLQRVAWGNDDVLVIAQDVSLVPDWRWACAMRSTICLQSLELGELNVTLNSGSPKEAGGTAGVVLPGELPLPVSIELQALAIDRLSWANGEARGELRAIQGDVAVSGDSVSVERVAVTHAAGTVDASLQLAVGAAWHLDLRAGVLLEDGAAVADLPRSWSLAVEGDVLSPSVVLESLGPPLLRVDSSIAVDQDWQGFAATARASGLESLAPLRALQPWLALAAPVDAEFALRDGALAVEASSAVTGYSDDPAELLLALRIDAGASWLLDALTLTGTDGTPLLNATGALGTPAAWESVIQLRTQELMIPEETGVALRGITGGGRLALAPGETLQWSITGLNARFVLAERPVALRGDLASASDQPLLPLGALQAVVDDREIDYARLTVQSAAELRLPEGLRLDGLTLREAALRVIPGAQTALLLETEGDISTSMAVNVTPSARGADWEIAPFTASIFSEQLRSEQTLRGRWQRDEGVLEADAFCWHLRASAACTDQLRVGDSGAVSIRLEGEERLQGALVESPYELLVYGQGKLDVSWDARQFSEARLDLELPLLRLDPFAGGDTAGALSFDQVRVSGQATAERQELQLSAGSPTLGSLEADVHRDGETLGGQVTIDALELAALTDLLPEMDLAEGVIAGTIDLTGTLARPLVSGELRATGVRATHRGTSIGLNDGQLRLTGSTAQFELEGGGMLGDGALRFSGVCCDDDLLRGSVSGDRNELRFASGLEVTVSPTLQLELGQRVGSVTGEVHVHRGLLEHSGPLGDGVALSEDIVRIDDVQDASRRFALSTDIRARIDPGFSLRSRQVEATLGGDVRLLSEPGEPPQLFGELQVLGGVFRAYGQGLRLDRGSVGFVGDPLNPDLNLSAVRDIRGEQLRVGVRATGSLEAPMVAMFSEPQRSERETLSYLLRGRPPDAGASADGTAMALALGASAVNQSGLLDAFNSVPGLSQVSLGAEGTENDTAATISAYVGERLYLSYGMGIYEPVNALTARLYLRSRLWLEVVSRLENSFDLYYRFDRN